MIRSVMAAIKNSYKPLDIPDIIKYDIHLYHSYLSAFFFSAGVPNGEFPEILITKCSSRFYCI
jgi:hypothetical protein